MVFVEIKLASEQLNYIWNQTHIQDGDRQEKNQ